jgi:hypothetical protein
MNDLDAMRASLNQGQNDLYNQSDEVNKLKERVRELENLLIEIDDILLRIPFETLSKQIYTTVRERRNKI